MDKYGNKVYAVDFDKTLSMARYPEVGEPNTELFKILIQEQIKGAKIILYTCRMGEPLKKAVEFCNKNGLYFDAINANVPSVIERFGDDPRKISADVYIDDKAVKPIYHGKLIEHLNNIDILSDQIIAMLELIAMCEDSASIKCIKTAAEMCQNRHDEIMLEVEGIKKEHGIDVRYA